MFRLLSRQTFFKGSRNLTPILSCGSPRFVNKGKWAPREVIVAETGDKYEQIAHVGHTDHEFKIDETQLHGGEDQHPSPNDYIMAALGASTSITIRKHANEKNWKLERVLVSVSHDRKNHQVVPESHSNKGKVDVYNQKIELIGRHLTHEQRLELFKAADHAPIYVQLKSEHILHNHLIGEMQHQSKEHQKLHSKDHEGTRLTQYQRMLHFEKPARSH